MNIVDINDRDRQMLELLAQGASNRSIADSMGYREGTMRVYLHGLYKKLGVGNKTNAVIWYFDRLKVEGRVAEGLPAVASQVPEEESFGDIALRLDLLAALGATSMFLGAYGRVWEVGNRLKGVVADPKTGQRRRQSRQLWEALLKGDFAYGKRLFDEDQVARLLVDSPADCVLLACMLRIGGYTRAADRVMAQVVRRKKGRPGISAKEVALVTALRDALDARDGSALAALHRLAVESSAKPFPRHAAMASLFWVYRALKDPDRARATANALCAEAETVRQQLHAMGERPLYRDASMPQPPSPGAKVAPSRQGKAAVTQAAALAS